MSKLPTHKDSTTGVDHIQLKVSSTAFGHDGYIPSAYTCDGININPPLHIENIPETTKCLALIIDYPDAPVYLWNHWLV
jgi:phosphatidylethanolamine-binding protein (PEBP) family uncharacterized protein